MTNTFLNIFSHIKATLPDIIWRGKIDCLLLLIIIWLITWIWSAEIRLSKIGWDFFSLTRVHYYSNLTTSIRKLHEQWCSVIAPRVLYRVLYWVTSLIFTMNDSTCSNYHNLSLVYVLHGSHNWSLCHNQQVYKYITSSSLHLTSDK